MLKLSKNQYDSLYNRPQSKPRKLTTESTTVQGEAFTVAQLFARAVAQGQLNSGDASYLDIPIEKLHQSFKVGMDLTEIEALKEHNKQLLRDYQALQDAETSQKEKMAQIAKEEALKEQWIKEQQQQQEQNA